MRKKILVLLFAVMVAVFAFSGVAFAADPPKLEVNVVSPGGGDLDITVTGIDSSGWHPGSVGEINTFSADGQFTVDYKSYAGNYGSLQSYVNASSTSGGMFVMTDWQDFDILSANHNYHTTGTFTAVASGTTADMNLKSIGSMYGWHEATNPWSALGLQGTYIAKQYTMDTSTIMTANMFFEANASGGASIYNSNIWGFGANENGTITANDGGGIRSLTASGTGDYRQYVWGSTNVYSSATLNVDGTGAVVTAPLPVGGVVDIIANFVSSLTSNPYTMTAK